MRAGRTGLSREAAQVIGAIANEEISGPAELAGRVDPDLCCARPKLDRGDKLFSGRARTAHERACGEDRGGRDILLWLPVLRPVQPADPTTEEIAAAECTARVHSGVLQPRRRLADVSASGLHSANVGHFR